MLDKRIVGMWSYTGTEIGGDVVHETLEILEDGTFHLIVAPTRYGKPLGRLESWGNWELDGEKLIVTPTRAVHESGAPDQGPIVKEGMSDSNTYTLEWLSDDEWASGEYGKYPPMRRVKE